MEQKENSHKVVPKCTFLQQHNKTNAKPSILLKKNTVSSVLLINSNGPSTINTETHTKQPEMVESNTGNLTKPKTTSIPVFKTPLKPVQPLSAKTFLATPRTVKPTNDATDSIKAEMASMNVQKLIIDPKSFSARKATPTNSNALPHPPQSARKAVPLASTFKFDPKGVTGIPWIKSKKTTVPKPFSFASDRLAAKRANAAPSTTNK